MYPKTNTNLQYTFMTLTKHIVHMVEKAIAIIQQEAATFVATQKTGYDGLDTDLITTADIAAQAMYQKYIEEHFPCEGIIGEEDLNKVGTNYRYFTIDPLDGTKAFGRRQSMGVGTMIAHVNEYGVVDAMCIGDINTGEMYYFGPDTPPTRKRFGVESRLGEYNAQDKMCGYASLRDHTENYPDIVQDLVRQPRGGIFEDINIESGSIGLHIARLWKKEIEMIILQPTFETPWDMTPIVGMNKVLGIVHIILNPQTLDVNVMDKPLTQDIVKLDTVELITHKCHVPEVLAWIENWKANH
jgi:fructose-1,6-bisphosphatase/inositol monophosphatase family enzyme